MTSSRPRAGPPARTRAGPGLSWVGPERRPIGLRRREARDESVSADGPQPFNQHEVGRCRDFFVSTDPALLDIPLIHDFLSNRSYWAAGVPLDVVRRSIAASLCFGVYEGTAQIGF